MNKRVPPETKKAPLKRNITPETAKKAPKKLVAPASPKGAPVAKRQKETKAKVDETLLPMKTGLKFIVSTYIRTLDIPAEKLEETIHLTLENLSAQADANGRKLDSLYWFREGCSVEIKNGKIFAKDPESNALVSGLKIKVVKPKKNKKEPAVEPEPIAEPAPAVLPDEISDEAIPAGEVIPSQEEELSDDDVTSIVEAEAPASSVEPAPAVVTAEVAEQPSDQPAPTTAETQESTLLTPEFITLITSTSAEFQRLRVEFDLHKSESVETTHFNLNRQVTALGDALASLPDPQFQLARVRLLRMRIATLTVEIEESISRFQQPDKKAVEMPSLIKGLATKVKAFSENAATWISEVDLITNTSRIPTEKEVQDALDKNTQLLAESDDLRKTISDIETSPTFDGALQPQISALKDQIAKASLDMEAPVKKLQAFLTNHRKPLSAPPPPPSARPSGNNVVNLRTVTTGDRRLPVNADDVLEGSSWVNKLSDWFRNLTK